MPAIRAIRAKTVLQIVFSILTALSATLPAVADWTHWRGPHQNGTVAATGLVEDWSRDGKNLVWRAVFTGRSTPVVFDGRVCANGRAGEGQSRQEMVACWNAETGEPRWQRRFNVYHTSVPWNRVGWGGVAGDPETGYLFAQLVNGRLVALDGDGAIAWEWRLGEDFGRFSGYGGRTNTPIVDQERLIVHVISASWGSHRGPGDRWVAFDKRSGEVIWVSAKGDPLKDLNTYSTPVIALIDGRRQMIAGGADGWIHSLDAHTGEHLWRFHLSQRGLNSSVVVDGTTVFAAHSEENVDTGVMGRLVAINAAGASGDVTASHEIWRVEELQAGYASPAVHAGRVYVADNSANLGAFDTGTGKPYWTLNYGTVGKGSPVVADGKIFLTEVNGNLRIVRPGARSAEVISEQHLAMPDGRYAEIYSSPAVAYGRVYFTTEEGVYCLGDKSRPFVATPAVHAGEPAPEAGTPSTSLVPLRGNLAVLRVVPGVVVTNHDQPAAFKVLGFDEKRRALGEVAGISWNLEGLPGTISADGRASFDGSQIGGTHNGRVRATLGELSAVADLRVAGPLPWSFDFEEVAAGTPPAGWLGVGKGARVRKTEDGKVLVQPKAPRGAPRATILFGPSSMRGYTIQADVKGNAQGRRMTDVGIVNQGYTMDLQGAHQRIQVQSWTSERRMRRVFPFAWQIGVWYTLKMRVDVVESKAIIRGKVWKRDEEEPAAWTVSVDDPLPIDSGSPGLYAFAPVEAFFDNVRVDNVRVDNVRETVSK